MKNIWEVVLSILIGITLGYVLGDSVVIFEPLVGLCIGMFKFIVAPLVFSSVVVSLAQHQKKSLAYVGVLTGGAFCFLTGIAILVALLVTVYMPFVSALKMGGGQPVMPQLSFVHWVGSMLPTNVLDALSSGNVTQILVCAVLVALGIRYSRTTDVFLPFFESLYKLSLTWMSWLMRILPLMIIVLVAFSVGNYGVHVGKTLFFIIAILWGICLFHTAVVYSALIYFIDKSKLKSFWTYAPAVWVTAFATTSAAASLPATLNAMKEMNISEDVLQFIAPLGAIANKGGTAIFHVTVLGLMSKGLGIPLSFGFFAKAAGIIFVTSFATGSIPGAGLVGLSLVIGVMGLPYEMFALAAGIDRFADMIRTPTNVVGDCVAAIWVDKIQNVNKSH